MECFAVIKKFQRRLAKTNPKLIFWVIFCSLFIVWTFTQFYRLNRVDRSGHDLAQYGFAMLDWRSTGKIPLLGPNISYILTKSSPLYYWLIYPFYLISDAAILYIHLAHFVYTWVIFLALALALHKQSRCRWSFLLLIAMFCFCPIILNSRIQLAWSPSFVWQPIVVAWYCLTLAQKSKHRVALSALSGIACAVAISLELLIVPIAVGLLLITALRLRKNILPLLLGFTIAMLIFWEPVLIIHNSVKSNNHSFFLPHKSPDPFTTRLHRLITWSISGHNYIKYEPLLAYSFYIFIIALVIFYARKTNKKKLLNQDWLQLAIFLIVSIIITLIPAIRMEGWYPVGTAVVIILLLTNLPGRFKYLLCALLLSYWLLAYVRILNLPYRASVSTTASCLKEVCQHVVPNQYYYALYTDAVFDKVPAYLLSIAGCPPAVRYQSSDPSILRALSVYTNHPLLVFHDLDTVAAEKKWPTENSELPYIGLKPFLDEFYTQAVASASCEGNWGWTLYNKVKE